MQLPLFHKEEDILSGHYLDGLLATISYDLHTAINREYGRVNLRVYRDGIYYFDPIKGRDKELFLHGNFMTLSQTLECIWQKQLELDPHATIDLLDKSNGTAPVIIYWFSNIGRHNCAWYVFEEKTPAPCVVDYMYLDKRDDDEHDEYIEASFEVEEFSTLSELATLLPESIYA